MKIFSLGFILTFVISSLVQHVNLTTIKEFFESMIVILPSLLLLVFICWQFIDFVYKKFKHRKSFSTANDTPRKIQKLNWQCLLIDGVWGSGKTTHYEKHYQYIDAKPNIYISCFSASRSELIAQIIQQQLCWKLLTLNGLLAKFMENNWQIFMPKNRVVVFDDLERLHAKQENYLDLIGIIDYLKTTNKCQVILIADISKTPHVFNSYMERVVDEVLMIPKLQLIDLFALEYNNPKDHDVCTNIQSKQIFIDEILKQCQVLYNFEQLNNLRIFKNVFIKLAIEILDLQKIEQWDDKQQLIYAKKFAQELKNIILKRYIYFIDNALFRKLCTSSVSVETERYYMLSASTVGQRVNSQINEEQKPSEHDILKARNLNNELYKYTRELKASDFNHKDKELFNKELDINTTNVKLIEFVLYEPEKFIEINSKNYEPSLEQRLLWISQNRQLDLVKWRNYLRDNFIPITIKKLKNSKLKTWTPEYYSSDYGVYLPDDFSSYYQMAIVLTQLVVDLSIIDDVVDIMVEFEKWNISISSKLRNLTIDERSINKSIKETFWSDKFYSLVWFLEPDVVYEINTIKNQVNQKIDEIFITIQDKIKQKIIDKKL